MDNNHNFIHPDIIVSPSITYRDGVPKITYNTQDMTKERTILARRPALYEAIAAGNRETVAKIQAQNRATLNIKWN